MCRQTYPHSQVFVITYNEGTFYSVSETNPVRRSILGMRLPTIVVHLGGGRPPLEIANLQCIATVASKLRILYSIQSP